MAFEGERARLDGLLSGEFTFFAVGHAFSYLSWRTEQGRLTLCQCQCQALLDVSKYVHYFEL